MTITLPLPHKRLSPNYSRQGSWRGKAAQIKIHRWRAYITTKNALASQPAPTVSRYTLTFYFPTRARRDDDNASAACKAYRDGIADALGIDDHTLRMSAAPEMLWDKNNPRLLITLLP